MINEKLYKLASEHMTYDIPYSTQSLIAELTYKLQAAEKDIEHSCRTCWYKHNDRMFSDVCMECHMGWNASDGKTYWKWRYYDEF